MKNKLFKLAKLVAFGVVPYLIDIFKEYIQKKSGFVYTKCTAVII